ncbi:hypothetical protein [Haploplasma axanthum]|uniref:Regulator of competence-specific genes n=1 Tax=Haploplasma axanthum TaxID=29552 RepID=A0A449BDC4_HAPAX|nr:hypothetical protein [Haploplasma axanthum]VEU80449.1 Regulator of competence-specific genes [Haploplasma axanthum]
MASTYEYIEHVLESLRGLDNQIRYRKMFGDYMVYIDDKPTLLVCDDTVFVKKLDVIKELMINADTGFPYNGAREHYVLDIDDKILTYNVIERILPELKVPVKRKNDKRK